MNRLQTLTPPVAIASGNFGFTYDALSRRTQMTRPNGLKSIYAYDNLSRLLSVLHQTGTTTLDGAAYAVDNAGNRTSRTPQPSGTATNYGYDNIYELLSATGGSTESYTYDAVGNRLTSGAGSYGYNTSNEMTSSPTATYTYDNNGNTLTKAAGSNTTTYAWDYENRMTSVTPPGSGGTISFKYDPFGRRIYKSSTSGTSIFAYDGDNIVEETNASGTAVARYSQGLNIDEPLAMLRGGAASFYHADGLGSVTSLSNAAGSIAQTYTFDSFGKLTGSTGSLTNPFQYTARESDTETGLYYYRARYYDQDAGRFIKEDPISFEGGGNSYSYTSNSPLSFRDPFGLAPETDCTDCGGKPKQGFDIAKKCCRNAGPMSSTENPNPYSPCETYMAVNAAAMFRYGGDGTWGQLVRGCLACMHSHGSPQASAHAFCYANAFGRTSRPSNLFGPGIFGFGRAVAGAVGSLIGTQITGGLPGANGSRLPGPLLYTPCTSVQ